MNVEKKLLSFPIGTSDFDKIRRQGSEYVDKTLLIAEILRNSMEVLLFPRPRRFGKTLNLSMLRYFFDNRAKAADLFTGLMIEQTPEFAKHQGKYPVIFVSFKDVKFQTLSDMTIGLLQVFSDLYRDHGYLLEILKEEADRCYFSKVRDRKALLIELTDAFRFLMKLLSEHTGQKVVVLLDEYDTPVHASYLHGYYDEMVSFMRALMGAAFKDNSNLFKGIITGILRVSKEGMFSGLNNIDVYSLLSDQYAQYFGFTQEEIDGLLQKTHRTDERQQVRDWYNGFQFGNCEIYNPWSIINYFSKGGEFKPYWVGTSDNALVKQIMAQGSSNLKMAFERLIQGESVEQNIDEFITLPALMYNEEVAWSLLLFSGYLKVTAKALSARGYRCQLKIPNREISFLFQGFLESFFDDSRYAHTQYQVLLDSLVKGDLELFEDLLRDYLKASFSYYDVKEKEPERFYHGFVLGLLVSLQSTHLVRSNRESGYGRYDVMIIPKDKARYPLATIIEFKVVRKRKDLKKGIEEAFQQIETKGYRTELESLGFDNIQTLAIVFFGKEMKLVVR